MNYEKDHYFKNAANWLLDFLMEVMMSPISLVYHVRNYLHHYLAALVFYVLPLVANIYLFQDRERWSVEINGDLFAVGVLTTVPIVNWFPIVMTVFETIGRLILL